MATTGLVSAGADSGDAGAGAHPRATGGVGQFARGVLVAHPHPDHYNSVRELLAGEEVPVIAHRDVDREIRTWDDASEFAREARR